MERSCFAESPGASELVGNLGAVGMGTSVQPKPAGAGTRCMARTKVQNSTPHTPTAGQVAQCTVLSGTQSVYSLCCASATGWHCPHLPHCLPALPCPCPPASSCPQPVQGVLGVTDVTNTKPSFFPFMQRRECHIWTCIAVRLRKGQGTGRRGATGQDEQRMW